MEKIKLLLVKIEHARFRLDANKEANYRIQLEKLLVNIQTDTELESIKKYWDEMDARTLAHLQNHLKEYQERAKAKIIIDEKVYNMKEWCTISQYAKIHGYKSTEAVSNRMRRGVISPENIAYIPELDIKLIRI